MVRLAGSLATTVALLVIVTPAQGGRAQEVLASGGEYLRGLREGTQAALTTPDGARLELELHGGGLRLLDHRAKLVEGVLHTPGGYRLALKRNLKTPRVDLVVSSPVDARTDFYFSRGRIWVIEHDPNVWFLEQEILVAYLPDGTRLDFDRPEGIMQVSVGGESWRAKGERFFPTIDPPTTLEGVNPITIYQTGDGNDWSRIPDPDSVLGAWQTADDPVSVDALLQYLQEPERSEWILAGLARLRPEDSASAGAYLLAGYFALPPGSLVHFRSGKKDIAPTLIAPGVLDIPSLGFMEYRGGPGVLGN